MKNKNLEEMIKQLTPYMMKLSKQDFDNLPKSDKNNLKMFKMFNSLLQTTHKISSKLETINLEKNKTFINIKDIIYLSTILIGSASVFANIEGIKDLNNIVLTSGGISLVVLTRNIWLAGAKSGINILKTQVENMMSFIGKEINMKNLECFNIKGKQLKIEELLSEGLLSSQELQKIYQQHEVVVPKQKNKLTQSGMGVMLNHNYETLTN